MFGNVVLERNRVCANLGGVHGACFKASLGRATPMAGDRGKTMSDASEVPSVATHVRKMGMTLIAVAPAFAAVGVVAAIVWWAAFITNGLDKVDGEVSDIDFRVGDFNKFELEDRLRELENPMFPATDESTEMRRLRLDVVSAESEIDRLRELTASLATRLSALERSQNADEMKHDGTANVLATLTERINMLVYYQGTPDGSADVEQASQ